MKYLFITLFITLYSLGYSQNDNHTCDKFYKIIIFKWSKDDKGNQKQNIVNIDENGNVTFNGVKNYKSLSPETINDVFCRFINEQNLIKLPPNNDPPRPALIPENNQQTITISVIEKSDYESEKNYENNSKYILRKVYPIDNNIYPFYKYLNNEQIEIFSDMLK